MSLLGLFGASKQAADSAEKVVDTGCNLIETAARGIDALVFTEEEKPEVSLKTMDSVIAMQKATTDENSVRSKARRILAIIIVANYLAVLDVAAALYCFDSTREAGRGVFDVANIGMGFMVSAVVIFYYGYYSLQSVVNAVKGKK